MKDLRWTRDLSDAGQVETHLRRCDEDFDPPLSTRVNLSDYAEKLSTRASRFEAWLDNDLAGLVAAYCNAEEGTAVFVTNVSVLPALRGRGIAERLLTSAIHTIGQGEQGTLLLEASRGAGAALALYDKLGFRVTGEQGDIIRLARTLNGGMK